MTSQNKMEDFDDNYEATCLDDDDYYEVYQRPGYSRNLAYIDRRCLICKQICCAEKYYNRPIDPRLCCSYNILSTSFKLMRHCGMTIDEQSLAKGRRFDRRRLNIYDKEQLDKSRRFIFRCGECWNKIQLSQSEFGEKYRQDLTRTELGLIKRQFKVWEEFTRSQNYDKNELISSQINTDINKLIFTILPYCVHLTSHQLHHTHLNLVRREQDTWRDRDSVKSVSVSQLPEELSQDYFDRLETVGLFDELPFGSTDIDVPTLSKGQLEAKRALEQAGIQCDLSHIGAIPVKHGIFRDGAADKRFKLAQKRKAKMAEWFRAAVRNRKH